MSSPESTHQSTRIILPHEVGIATTTFYRNWDPHSTTPNQDNVRGDLAIDNLRSLAKAGYRLYVVDGGSSTAFVETLHANGITAHQEEEGGMGAVRRQSWEGAYSIEGTKATAWTEPEKRMKKLLPYLTNAIANGADAAIPDRGMGLWTYPSYQMQSEIANNKTYNDMLRERGLLPQNAPEIDAWSGPRVIRNDDDIFAQFMQRFEFTEKAKPTSPNLRDISNYRNIPDTYANFLFISIASMLAEGYRVDSVPVPYMHPAIQTAIEQDSPELNAKRDLQGWSILHPVAGYLDYLVGDPNAAIQKVAA